MNPTEIDLISLEEFVLDLERFRFLQEASAWMNSHSGLMLAWRLIFYSGAWYAVGRLAQYPQNEPVIHADDVASLKKFVLASAIAVEGIVIISQLYL